MSATESRAKLARAAKVLLAEWQQAQEIWRDENGAQFEKKYVAPLESSIRAAVQAMERIGALIDKAQRECEDSREVNT